MHTVLTRANALAAYTMSVLAGLTFLCFLSTFFIVRSFYPNGNVPTLLQNRMSCCIALHSFLIITHLAGRKNSLPLNSTTPILPYQSMLGHYRSKYSILTIWFWCSLWRLTTSLKIGKNFHILEADWTKACAQLHPLRGDQVWNIHC